MPDETVWEDIKRAWIAGKLSKLKLCDHFKITTYQLDYRMNRDGWPRRPNPAKRKTPSTARPKRPQATGSGPQRADHLPADRSPLPAVPSPAAPSPATPPPPFDFTTPGLVRQSRRVLGKKLFQIEIRLDKEMDAKRTAADGEREAREITGTIAAISRTQDIENVDQRSAAGNSGTDAPSAGPDETAALRRDVAERLERLGEEEADPSDD